MRTKDKTQSLPVKVKESIDFIYNITTEQGEGYRGGFSTFDNVTKRVIAELVKRGIVAKEQDRTKPRTQFVYKWAVGTSPTRALYGSVTDTLRKNRREYNYEYNQSKKTEKKVQATDTVEEKKEQAAIESPIESFSTKELWDEIKRRGYSIEDNRLVIVRKEYLE